MRCFGLLNPDHELGIPVESLITACMEYHKEVSREGIHGTLMQVRRPLVARWITVGDRLTQWATMLATSTSSLGAAAVLQCRSAACCSAACCTVAVLPAVLLQCCLL